MFLAWFCCCFCFNVLVFYSFTFSSSGHVLSYDSSRRPFRGAPRIEYCSRWIHRPRLSQAWATTKGNSVPNFRYSYTVHWRDQIGKHLDVHFNAFSWIAQVCNSWQLMVNEWNIPENRPEFLMIDLNEVWFRTTKLLWIQVYYRNLSKQLVFVWNYETLRELVCSIFGSSPKKSQETRRIRALRNFRYSRIPWAIVLPSFQEFTRVSLILSYTNMEMLERLSTVIRWA